jgi:hypothetical protein
MNCWRRKSDFTISPVLSLLKGTEIIFIQTQILVESFSYFRHMLQLPHPPVKPIPGYQLPMQTLLYNLSFL